MMNSYFDHGSAAGFYNPAHQAAAAEAYRDLKAQKIMKAVIDPRL